MSCHEGLADDGQGALTCTAEAFAALCGVLSALACVFSSLCFGFVSDVNLISHTTSHGLLTTMGI